MAAKIFHSKFHFHFIQKLTHGLYSEISTDVNKPETSVATLSQVRRNGLPHACEYTPRTKKFDRLFWSGGDLYLMYFLHI